MLDKFEEIFSKILNEGNYSGWWELFDSDDFEKVEQEIANTYFNGDIEAMNSNTDYKNWYEEMYWDL